MLHFNNIKELLNLLARTKELLTEMFEKRKSFAYKYEMALELADEEVVEILIAKGVLRQSGAYIELDEQYLGFFEQILEVNEEINTAYIQENIGQVKQNINFYLQENNEQRKYSYLKQVKSAMRKIGRITLRNIIDLNRNIENAFKSEPNYKIKIVRLESFDQKRKDIQQLIEQTERMILGEEEQTFFKTAMDDELKYITSQLRLKLTEARHNLIETQKQVIEFLNQVKFQSRLVEKIKQVKYLKDQFELKAKTNLVEVLQKSNAVNFESKPAYPLRLSLDNLQTDEARNSIEKVALKLKQGKRNALPVAEGISDAYLQTETEEEIFINLQAMRNGFAASNKNLYQFVMEYNYPRTVLLDEKLTIFCQLVSMYELEFSVTDDYGKENQIEYAMVFPE
ncbi:MAG: hypothetical protein V9E96_00395 [Chitinophagaceae bacterium]|jgi:hypothetical protein|nr:hypothetical protein [Chitinophagaceae bacterium]